MAAVPLHPWAACHVGAEPSALLPGLPHVASACRLRPSLCAWHCIGCSVSVLTPSYEEHRPMDKERGRGPCIISVLPRPLVRPFLAGEALVLRELRASRELPRTQATAADGGKGLAPTMCQACTGLWGTGQSKVEGPGLMGLTFRQERNSKQHKEMRMSGQGLEARGEHWAGR